MFVKAVSITMPMPTKLVYPNFLKISIVRRIINELINGKKIKASSDSKRGGRLKLNTSPLEMGKEKM
jgi:hypothetical protein